MSTKRVFANNNNNLNFNDYLKYKNGKEIIKNIKTKQELNKKINIFLSYDKFMLLTKAYFKFFVSEGPIISIPVDIYNSNVSYIAYENLLSHIKDCNECRFSKDITRLYDCDAVKGILYPYGKYIEYKTSQTFFLHNRINLDNTCQAPYCKDLIQSLALDKTTEIIEIFPSQNNFVIQPLQEDNYNQIKRMNAYAIYPHLCTKKQPTEEPPDIQSPPLPPTTPAIIERKPKRKNKKNEKSPEPQPHPPPTIPDVQKLPCDGCGYDNLCKKVTALFID